MVFKIGKMWYNLCKAKAAIRGASSSGRARHSHCRGEEFESPALHQISMIWRFFVGFFVGFVWFFVGFLWTLKIVMV